MLSVLNNIKIKTLGNVMAGLLILVAAGVIGISVFTSTEVNRIGSTWEKFEKGVATKSDILARLRSDIGYGGFIYRIKDFVLRRDRPRIVKIQARIMAATVNLVAYKNVGVNPREEGALNVIGGVLNKYIVGVSVAEKLASEGRVAADIDKAIKIDNKPALDAIVVLDKELQAARDASAKAVYGSVAAASSFVTMFATMIMAVLGLLIVSYIWFARWRLAKGLTGLADCMTALASGNNDVDVPSLAQTDEIGDMARSVQVFKENAVEMKRLEEEKIEQEKCAEEEKRATINSLANDFEGQVMGIVETVSASSTQLQATAGSMSATAEETSRQAMSVAAAAEEATTNVQTVASAAEELSASIGEINRQVGKSTEIATKADSEAELTNETVRSLAEKAQNIGEVVDLISEIAEQTNLLALNATIEAARAGESGKGFAVVASEVKNLATQTAKATEEIGEQIGEMRSVTGDAVSAIRSIGATIKEISGITESIASAVGEQGSATQEIAENTVQAAAGTQEVSSNISGVTQAASETGAVAQQVLSAADELSKQAVDLGSELDGFIAKIRAA